MNSGKRRLADRQRRDERPDHRDHVAGARGRCGGPGEAIRRESTVAPMAAPRTTAADGAPAQTVVPARSLATIVATVTAAICPVLPSATPAISDRTVRRRRLASRLGDRSSRRASITATGQFDKAAEGIGESHLLGRSCPDPDEVGGGDDHGDAACP